MSGIGKRTRPPNIDRILQSKLYNPSTDFPEDLRDKIYLCDRDAIKPEEYEAELDRIPIGKPFPPYDPPYKISLNEKEFYLDKDDRKALNDKRVSDIARIEELRKRKKRMKELKEIYDTAQANFEKSRSAQNSRSQKSSTADIQDILNNSNKLSSSEAENSNESSSVNDTSSEDDIDDNDNDDHYASSDDEEPRDRRRKYQEKSRSSRSKSEKRDDNYDDSPKKKSLRQIHEPDKEKNYQIVISGKNTSIPFVNEVYNQQKDLLDKLKQTNSNSQSDEALKKIQEQEDKVNAVHKILIDLSVIPESPSMAPNNNLKPEKMREHDIYQRKLDLAHKEIEKEKQLMNIHQDKIESASSRANAIDESMKDIFGPSDDSNSSDSDGDLLNGI